MDKQELKQKIRKAIEESDFRDDIAKVSLFGSYASGTPRPDSDVDLLIEFVPTARFGFFHFFDIREDLERRVEKKIDLLTPQSISKYIRKNILEQAEEIYEKE